MNTETEKHDMEASTLCDLSRKAGRFVGKVIKYEERERAGEHDNVAVKTVGCLVKGIITVSDTAVKLVTAPFAKKEADAPHAPAEEAAQDAAEAVVCEAPAVEVAIEAAEQAAAEPCAEIAAEAAPEAEVAAAEAPPAEISADAAEQIVAEEPLVEIAAEAPAAQVSEAPGMYSRSDLEEKTKQQLMEISEGLGVSDAALWRPKDDLIARILSKQNKEE
ncbi:MAG: hypothetical protein WCQ99_06920 [Pseudomonadota bacterium]